MRMEKEMQTVTPMDEHTLKLVNDYLTVRGLPTMNELPCKLFVRDPEVMRRLDAAGWEEFPHGSGSIRKKTEQSTSETRINAEHLKAE